MAYKYDPKRDLNPHKPARMAMWLWSKRYSQQNAGSMGFWDSLSEREKVLARQAVAEIMAARDEEQHG